MSKRRNEIQWRDWSAEALEQAEREGKPILLAITATWCHWCHVMDDTTYRNPEVVELINSRFIPIRTNTDRRPDLNNRYNMGGWPTAAFVTPRGDVLTGTTYLPPMRMAAMLQRLAVLYDEDHQEIIDRAEETRRLDEMDIENIEKPDIQLTAGIPKTILTAVENAFDPTYAGFGREQKFLHVPVLELLLASYRRTGNTEHLEMVKKTLDAMRIGGIHDQVEGGFFRYSVTREWNTPHYEKMLEDNAGLLGAYIHTYSLTLDAAYLNAARSIMGYLENTLFDENTGTFFGSQDAREEYYQLPKEERTKVQPPAVDRTIYVNWNAMAADAYLRAFEATGEELYRDLATNILDFLVSVCRRDTGFAHFYDGEPHGFGLLSDQVHAGAAFLRAYECTGDRSLLGIAAETAEFILSGFTDTAGGFFDITEERLQQEHLPYREKLLDENSYAARFLSRLAYYAHKPVYRSIAEAALKPIADEYDKYGILASPYALAVMEIIEEPVKVAITGNRQDPRTEELLGSTLMSRDPSSIVQVLDEYSSEEELQEAGIEEEDRPQASVCVGGTCRPASDPEQLRLAIKQAQAKGLASEEDQD